MGGILDVMVNSKIQLRSKTFKSAETQCESTVPNGWNAYVRGTLHQRESDLDHHI